MTFAEMITRLQDRLGLTSALDSGTRNRLDRVLNDGKDRVVAAFKWHWLETSATQLFTSGTRNYQMTTACIEVISLEDFSGNAIRKVERDTYDEMHRPSTATGTPTVYTLQGWQASGAQSLHVYPSPSANTSGTLRYIPRISSLTSANDTLSFDYMPITHHFAVVKAAEVEFYRQEGQADMAQTAEAQLQDEINRLAAGVQSPVQRSGAEQ
jgi:hypothetical protein